MAIFRTAALLIATMLSASEAAHSQQTRFHLQEATIDDVHRAIRQGQITCRGLVQLYINRAKAYNGVAD
jgi:amidase